MSMAVRSKEKIFLKEALYRFYIPVTQLYRSLVYHTNIPWSHSYSFSAFKPIDFATALAHMSYSMFRCKCNSDIMLEEVIRGILKEEIYCSCTIVCKIVSAPGKKNLREECYRRPAWLMWRNGTQNI